MSRMSKFYLFQLLGWGLFAVLTTYVAQLNDELTLHVILINFMLALSGIGLSTLFRFYIVKNQWNLLPTEKLLQHVFLSLSLLSISYTAWYFLLLFAFGQVILHWDVFSILGSLISVFILFAIWTAIYFIWHSIENSRAALIKRLQLESSMKDLEIKTMRSNLQPHFIFNALNSIRALIDEDPELARLAITKISNILRNSITKQEATDTLENELQLVDDYLDLEKIRFEERLHVFKSIDPKTLPIQVPTMMLQTLVENAIKHGISKLEQGGDIHIKTFIQNHQLCIELINTGSLDTESKNENSLGFGLSSSLQRLHHIYGDNASLRIEELDSKVKVTILINVQHE